MAKHGCLAKSQLRVSLLSIYQLFLESATSMNNCPSLYVTCLLFYKFEKKAPGLLLPYK